MIKFNIFLNCEDELQTLQILPIFSFYVYMCDDILACFLFLYLSQFLTTVCASLYTLLVLNSLFSWIDVDSFLPIQQEDSFFSLSSLIFFFYYIHISKKIFKSFRSSSLLSCDRKKFFVFFW